MTRRLFDLRTLSRCNQVLRVRWRAADAHPEGSKPRVEASPATPTRQDAHRECVTRPHKLDRTRERCFTRVGSKPDGGFSGVEKRLLRRWIRISHSVRACPLVASRLRSADFHGQELPFTLVDGRLTMSSPLFGDAYSPTYVPDGYALIDRFVGAPAQGFASIDPANGTLTWQGDEVGYLFRKGSDKESWVYPVIVHVGANPEWELTGT